MPGYEWAIIPSFERAVSQLQGKTLYPLMQRMASRHWSFRVKFEVRPAPLTTSGIDFANLLSLGTPGYNEVTGYYEQQGHCVLGWTPNNADVQIKKGPQRGQIIPNPQAYDLAVLEKLHDNAHSTTVFVAAGLGVNGMREAAEYLLAHWGELQKSHGERPFTLCLSFRDVNSDPNGWRAPLNVQEFAA